MGEVPPLGEDLVDVGRLSPVAVVGDVVGPEGIRSQDDEVGGALSYAPFEVSPFGGNQDEEKGQGDDHAPGVTAAPEDQQGDVEEEEGEEGPEGHCICQEELKGTTPARVGEERLHEDLRVDLNGPEPEEEPDHQVEEKNLPSFLQFQQGRPESHHQGDPQVSQEDVELVEEDVPLKMAQNIVLNLPVGDAHDGEPVEEAEGEKRNGEGKEKGEEKTFLHFI